MTNHRKYVTECFRDFCERHAIVFEYTDGEEVDDSMIMCLYGALQGQWRTATQEMEQNNEQQTDESNRI